MKPQIKLGVILLTAIAVLGPGQPAGAAAKSYKLQKKFYRLDQVTKIKCGWLKNVWQPGPAMRKGRFTPFKSTLADLRKQAQAASGSAKARLNQRIKRLRTKIANQKAAFCDTLAAPANVGALGSLPDVGTIVQSTEDSSLSFTGTPPTIPEIPGLGADEIFWRPGVIQALINSTADAQQCSEFHIGQNDGDSGGLNSCVQAQTIGQTFEPIMIAFQPMCYMKRGMTEANLDAGGIQITQGELPGDDITRLFKPPQGDTARLVRINRPGAETFFIRISSINQNNEANNQFQATVWICTGGATARKFWIASVSNDGLFSAETGDLEDAEAGGFHTVVSAYLTGANQNQVNFDTSRSRLLQAEYEEPAGVFKFKNEVSLDTDLVTSKVYGIYNSGTDLAKIFTASEISGTSVAELRFLQGAFTRIDQNGANPPSASTGASEYRDTYYASAPANSMVSLVTGFDFDSDIFWDSEPAVSLDMTPFPCDAQPDIEILMDLSNQTLLDSLADCEAMRIPEMLFCDSTEINQAESNWPAVCLP